MEADRLKKLEKLVGLELEAGERSQLLLDLQALEDFVGKLSPLPEGSTEVPAAKVQDVLPPLEIPLDAGQLIRNAPSWAEGFFQVPSPLVDSAEERS